MLKQYHFLSLGHSFIFLATVLSVEMNKWPSGKCLFTCISAVLGVFWGGGENSSPEHDLSVFRGGTFNCL